MNIKKQSGAVSLFVVIFAMLIITVITLGFTRLMLQDQLQSSNSDLSQSALDSAQAGTEDAKRALLYYQAECAKNAANCTTLEPQIASSKCNEGIYKSGVIGVVPAGTSYPEVLIQQDQTGSGNDKKLNQAYTCVKMALATPDYLGVFKAGETRTIPLITRSGQAFDTVTIRWFSQEDVTSGAVKVPSTSSQNKPLLRKADWDSATPSVVRAQLIQFGANFTLKDFDASSGGKSNTNTVFLYPVSDGGFNDAELITRDNRASSPNGEPTAVTANSASSAAPLATTCKTAVLSGGYACSMSLKLPDPINGSSSDRTAYLRLAALYNSAHFQVVLSQGSLATASPTIISFKDVQPEIDSTGRANDLYRRVQSRVDLYDTTFPYPDATIEVNGSFCKDFRVTDVQYIAGSCTP